MSHHVISTHDTYELAFYILHGYRIDNIHAIPNHGTYRCMCSISGGDELKALQLSFLNNPEVKLNDFRNALHRVTSLIMKAKKQAQARAKKEAAND